MDPIKIESSIPTEKIHEIIEEFPINKDVTIKYEKYEDNENRFRYIFSLNNEKKEKDYFFLDFLTKFVGEMIIKFYTDDIVSKNLEQKIGLIENTKRLEIMEDVKEVLNSNTLFLKEKQKVKKEIFDYFVHNKTLVIDGYLKFRSKSFHELIDRCIELVLGDFQMEVEYNEFIDTLKFIVDSQTSQIDLINITLQDHSYKLTDSEFREIDNEHISIVLGDLYDDKISDSDVLLSTIIALSPEKIIMHISGKDEDEVTAILKEIFEEKMEICSGCENCNI